MLSLQLDQLTVKGPRPGGEIVPELKITTRQKQKKKNMRWNLFLQVSCYLQTVWSLNVAKTQTSIGLKGTFGFLQRNRGYSHDLGKVQEKNRFFRLVFSIYLVTCFEASPAVSQKASSSPCNLGVWQISKDADI